MTKISNQAIGQRIKAIRLDQGVTLEEFGQLLGAGKSNVSKWENGRNLPNPRRLKLIADMAGVSVPTFIGI